jgi:hypothetical protein
MGACCFSDGICSVTLNDPCVKVGGLWYGDGSTCGDINCEPFGACCIDGNCAGFQYTQPVCEAKGGEYFGDGTTDCPPKSPCSIDGACCIPAQGLCFVMTEPSCFINDGIWKGPNTDCIDHDFNDGDASSSGSDTPSPVDH